ncbi:MAG: hypothetical protein F6J93_16175 [Oscillatoria sp. SIO1A7]|nr:hypothetical protein [Oscillatoria sp. SIO1A7]
MRVSQIDGGVWGEASQYENPRFTAEMVKGHAVAPTLPIPIVYYNLRNAILSGIEVYRLLNHCIYRKND